MKINLTYTEKVTGEDRILVKEFKVEADRLLMLSPTEEYEIKLDSNADIEAYNYHNQLSKVLLVSFLNGVKTIHGYLPKLIMFAKKNNNELYILGIDNMIKEEEINAFFSGDYKKQKDIERLNVQFIEVNDFVKRQKIKVLKDVRKLLKRGKNAK